LVTVKPLAFAFFFTARQSSSSIRIDRNGVIEPRTHSLNPSTSQETRLGRYRCQPTKGCWQLATQQLGQSKVQLLAYACHAL